MTEIAERVYATIIFTALKNARLLLLLLKSSYKSVMSVSATTTFFSADKCTPV